MHRLATKILLLLALNLVLVGAGFAAAILVQIRVNPRWLLAGNAGERLQKIAEDVQSDLAIAGSERAAEILERYAETREGLAFMLFELRPRDAANRAGEVREIAGRLLDLPSEVRGALGRPRVLRLGRLARALAENGGLAGPGNERSPRGDPPPPGAGAGERLRRPGQPLLPPRGQPLQGDVIAAGKPPAYWFVVRIPPLEDDRAYALVIRANSLLAATFLLDPHPWLLAGAGAIVLSALFWLPFVRGMTSDIHRLMSRTEEIAAGRFETPVALARRDELGRLAEAIEQMARRLSTHAAGQRRFLGDAAHELASPVARMQTAVAILEQRVPETEQGYLGDLREELDEMAGLISELLSFSRATHGRPAQLATVALRGLVERAWNREQSPPATLQIEVAPELQVQADPALLQRAVANVLRNAVRYAGASGPLTARAHVANREIHLEILDQGPGVPAESLPRLFEPFYRPEASRSREFGGAGLGLAIVKTCVEACGGTVAARNTEPQGFAVTLRLTAA